MVKHRSLKPKKMDRYHRIPLSQVANSAQTLCKVGSRGGGYTSPVDISGKCEDLAKSGRLAQRLAQWSDKPEARGSNPRLTTMAECGSDAVKVS